MKVMLMWLLPFFVILQYVTGNAPLPWGVTPSEAGKPAEAIEETVPDAGKSEPETDGAEEAVPDVHIPEKLGFETGNIGSGERGPICSAEEGRDSLRLVLACYVSARTGERVSVWDKRVYDI